MGPRLIALTILLLITSCQSASQRFPEWPRPSLLSSKAPLLSDEAAYTQAIQFQRLGRHIESIPYFRAVLGAHPDIAQLHLEYGQALHNASLETDLSRGFVRYSIGNSFDRSAIAREALKELKAGLDISRSDAERAYALFTIARVQAMFGLPTVAALELDEAAALAPGTAQIAHQRELLTASLRGVPSDARALSGGAPPSIKPVDVRRQPVR